ncbi:hypothetical protein JX266_009997 [Neoarthrinium moseri]|nr:hypothetical protein JX266_009997 [Neoarthrinium moseri]
MPSISGAAASSKTPRMRVRELLPALYLGDYEPGPLNSLTDVAGVKVHMQEIHSRADGGADDGGVNTGVTAILPRDSWARKACYAGLFSFNGAGELTGSHWLNETGILSSPIVLTSTVSVGAAHEGVYRYAVQQAGRGAVDTFLLPVVGETFDGYLNDVGAFAVRPEHVVRGLEGAAGMAAGEPVREGNVGGGTGMICHYFKGGTGSASRLVPGLDGAGGPKTYTIAALVQANYGKMHQLRIGGVGVGRILADATATAALAELVAEKTRKDGSIIVVLATDAPLHPAQLRRVARRATVGLARVGGQGHNPSGDIFVAFSTGNEIPVQTLAVEEGAADPYKPTPLRVEVVDDTSINGLFEAAADATEEAIYNALCMAEDMVGFKGRKVKALPLDRVREIMARHL